MMLIMLQQKQKHDYDAFKKNVDFYIDKMNTDD